MPSSVTTTVLAAASLRAGLRVDHRAHRLALVETQKHGCGHGGRAFPVLVDLLLEARESVGRDGAPCRSVRRAAPDELDVDVGAAAGERKRGKNGGARDDARRRCT